MPVSGERLVTLLSTAVDQGLRGPSDLILAVPDLIQIIAPRARDHIAGAWLTHQVIIAGIDSLPEPTRSALRALYGLEHSTGGRTVLLTKTQRRERAGIAIQRSGERFKRAYERPYLTDLASELQRRIRTPEDTTFGRRTALHDASPRMAPPPPPPASSYRPRNPYAT
ncbi:hypothetical protein [Frankia sp. AiPa1]|uniref:hypothetical protein n=1 Tax=Frankia sp. AiPa1 TaxID=573492 RepID=UPI00202B9D83|nr:hypothetical protein [Frankia sp. AiPa1]MCL9758789.1 hypothetical protein [Frankia sp. AiPa1]